MIDNCASLRSRLGTSSWYLSIMLITHASRLDNAELTAELSRLARCEREATAGPHRAPRRVRRAAAFRGRRISFPVPVLHGRAPPLRGRGLQPDHGGAGGPTVSRHHREARERRAQPDDRCASSSRHLTCENHQELLAGRLRQGQAGRRGVVGLSIPAAGRGGASAEGALSSAGAGGATGTGVAGDDCRTHGVPTPTACPPVVGGDPLAGAHVAPNAETPVPFRPCRPRRALVRPLAAERYEIRFTASGEMREKLRVAQDLLGHAIPSGDIAQVFDRALTLLVADLSRKKFAATRGRDGPAASRTIRETSRRKRNAASPRATAADAPSSPPTAGDATRVGSWSSTTSSRMPRAGSRRSTTSNCGVVRTTATRSTRFFGPGKRRTRGDVVRESGPVYGTGL